jgi:hypothetical protein
MSNTTRSKQLCRPVRTDFNVELLFHVLALGNDPQPVGQLVLEVAVLVRATAGTATAPAGTAATARTASAVRIDRRM